MSDLPSSTTYLIVGAGVHGLSTAWHLAMALEARGSGGGHDIVLIDKTGPGAGATGVACGCVRNFYMTEPLHGIVRHSVDVWMADPVNFGFQQVGYVSCGEDNQAEDYARVHASQQRADYPSDLYVGAEAKRFLKGLWPDFNTEAIGVALHEKVSGYAGTRQSLRGLEEKCRQYGVRCHWGVEVTGYEQTGGRVSKVHTNRGAIACDAVVLGLGPWTPVHWAMLGLPERLDLHYPGGATRADQDMWTYWRLREGEVYVDAPYRDARDMDPPVLHVELMNTPVIDPETGRDLEDHLYVYWKNGSERMDRPGIQGGGIPVHIGPQAALEPYGKASDAYQAEPGFADMFTAAMGQLMGRFKGCRGSFRERRNGGIGAFTPDNVPVFDWIRDNVYLIADSSHGFKMTGAGKLLAHHIATGEPVAELAPFAFSRFAEGRTYGSGTTNCPWV